MFFIFSQTLGNLQSFNTTKQNVGLYHEWLGIRSDEGESLLKFHFHMKILESGSIGSKLDLELKSMKMVYIQERKTFFCFFGMLGGPLGFASGEKCFLNPIGFRKFFECYPNHYAKGFVRGGGNSTTVNLREI